MFTSQLTHQSPLTYNRITMKILLLCFLSLLIFSIYVNAQKKNEPQKLKTYYLALLRKGPHRDQDSVSAVKIQEAHLANITRLYKDGKLDLAGPFLDDGDIQGIFVFNVKSMEEAKQLVDSDPAVKAGRLILELHPWMSKPGAKLR